MLLPLNARSSPRGARAPFAATGGRAATPGPAPAFLIVGTSHSGTTLVQRLACELRGVRVPPETHFFETFVHDLLGRRRFPLDAAGLAEEVNAFAALPTSRGMELDAAVVVRDLGARCAAPLDLFAALVRALAGDAAVYGEKTPLHLLWWRRLTAALPALRLVAVVRDPRAVVASHVADPWGWVPHVLAAERWAADQREVASACRALPPERLLVLRYEDVVADPDGARARIGSFLGVAADALEPPDREPLFLAWEGKKERALGAVTMDRVGAWRESLTAREVADVTAICRTGMLRFGHGDAAPSRAAALLRLATLRPAAQATRVRFRAARGRERARIRSARIAGPVS